MITIEPPVSPELLQPAPIPGWLDQICEVLADQAGTTWRPLEATAEAPFVAVHHWHAGAVADLIGEAATLQGRDPIPHEAVRTMHARAATGESISKSDWHTVLEPALREVYLLGYPREGVHARGSSAAASYARSRGWSPDEAQQYGEAYARMNTETGERVYAESNAIANAAAYARAFSAGHGDDYARAWPYALVRAWIAAYAGSDGIKGPAADEARKRLRDGLSEAVTRARTIT
ncbi:SpcZ (plasmid) [Streptomyces sp. AHU1]|uniref:SpcZ n=1 Tax=Streptomyces sp. AHU1 TaxID=3377215 RepID=UPI003877C142